MPRTYRPPRRSTRRDETRRKIMAAVRELLADGTFHESTVEEVADRAGVARATLYQHFGSRFDLIDAICETSAGNPALSRIKDAIESADVDTALSETIANSVRFWASEDPILRGLYGVVAIDPAAQAFVDRQRRDRHEHLQRLVRRLRADGRLRPRLTERHALATLMLVTSYESFRELRDVGLSDREVSTALLGNARVLLLGD